MKNNVPYTCIMLHPPFWWNFRARNSKILPTPSLHPFLPVFCSDPIFNLRPPLSLLARSPPKRPASQGKVGRRGNDGVRDNNYVRSGHVTGFPHGCGGGGGPYSDFPCFASGGERSYVEAGGGWSVVGKGRARVNAIRSGKPMHISPPLFPPFVLFVLYFLREEREAAVER